MWIEVIRKMDMVYSDLIRYEVDLERKNAALEDAQAFVSSVIESVSDVLIVCDRDGSVRRVNSALARLVGRPVEVLVGAKLSDLVEGMDLLRRIAGKGYADLRDVEVRFRVADGVSDIYAVNCATRRNHVGRPVGIVLTGRPVGDLRRAYEALRQAHADLTQMQERLIQQEKLASLGRLVAGVAHELNNPISFVYGNIHVLDRYRKRLTEYLAAVHGEADQAALAELRRQLKLDALLDDLGPLIEGTLEGAMRVSDIVKNLRRLSFSGSDEPHAVDLGRVIPAAARLAVASRKAELEIASLLGEDLLIQGFEGQIHQVIVNLVDNALDAMRNTALPKLTLAARRDGDRIRVTIADNGTGIAETARDKIFEPFFTTKSVGEGTGLGLWISYSIVKEHGGELSAANRPEGGAEFQLLLPAMA
jgi:two-component system sensor histidine kinase HupT/HoxJ